MSCWKTILTDQSTYDTHGKVQGIWRIEYAKEQSTSWLEEYTQSWYMHYSYNTVHAARPLGP